MADKLILFFFYFTDELRYCHTRDLSAAFFQYIYSSPFSSVSGCEIFKSKTLIDVCGHLGELAVAARLTRYDPMQ